MRDDIQNILSGKSQVKYNHLIQTTCSYLKRSEGTSSMVKNHQQLKEEETKRLIQQLLYHKIILTFFISQNISWLTTQCLADSC
jgi:hypothetical protein